MHTCSHGSPLTPTGIATFFMNDLTTRSMFGGTGGGDDVDGMDMDY